jgi:hypothetical protein
MRTPFFAVIAASLVGSLSCGPARQFSDSGVDVRRHEAATEDPAAWLDCVPGQQRCYNDIRQVCVVAGEFVEVQNDDCTTHGQVCVEDGNPDPNMRHASCLPCRPNATSCSPDETSAWRCAADGSGWSPDPMLNTLASMPGGPNDQCNFDNGEACRNGRCVVLCQDGSIENTNIGCEYYAVDLDNAVTGAGQSAASQQYAVVVSNPDRFHTARVRIEWNTAPQGMPARPSMVASAVIAPMDLEVFPLPAREVDCSAPGTFNTGTGTCLSSQAYHITSTIPVIAYQFNPLSNEQVFSNDASLLVPTNSLAGDYVAISWPQTIADTASPDTDIGIDLRTFMTVVGTRENTHVQVTPTAHVIPGGPIPSGAEPGTPIDVVLGPFDVLNLETGGFNADLTGSTVTTDHPVAVFMGSEAWDVPMWTTLSERRCCADHGEEQIYPRRTVASDYVAPHLPPRTPAVAAAGGQVAVVTEPQWYRVLNAGQVSVHVVTTLPGDPSDPMSDNLEFNLSAGNSRVLRGFTDFEVHADGPVIMSTMTAGQEALGIPTDTPGGDPSFIMVPPIRQWRQNYVFLTPDKYAFDFVTIVARPNAHVTLDDTPLPYADCPMSRADACVNRVGQPACPDPNYVVYRCQLSFPIIDPAAPARQNIMPGRQADGVHTVTSDDREQGVMVIVSGFDEYVGYGYPGGTRLTTID